MATEKSSAPAHAPTEGHKHQDDRLCVCNDGWITLGQIALDAETGEEVEEYALYLCQRCSEEKRGAANV